jgi:hypothetical protein
MRYAAIYRRNSEPLAQIHPQEGCINAWAAWGEVRRSTEKPQANPRVGRLKSTQNPSLGKLRTSYAPQGPWANGR